MRWGALVQTRQGILQKARPENGGDEKWARNPPASQRDSQTGLQRLTLRCPKNALELVEVGF
jgi:hypothetical protein